MGLLDDLQKLIARDGGPVSRTAPRICFDCDRLSTELRSLKEALRQERARYKHLRADYTKKTMELADLKREHKK